MLLVLSAAHGRRILSYTLPNFLRFRMFYLRRMLEGSMSFSMSMSSEPAIPADGPFGEETTVEIDPETPPIEVTGTKVPSSDEPTDVPSIGDPQTKELDAAAAVESTATASKGASSGPKSSLFASALAGSVGAALLAAVV
jgi:hypothetical protein